MLMSCPHCGPRDINEFTYAGDATRTRPALDAAQSEWCSYLFERTNPMGAHREHWQHTAGCRAVLTVERDTLNHAVLSTALTGPFATARAPEPAE